MKVYIDSDLLVRMIKVRVPRTELAVAVWRRAVKEREGALEQWRDLHDLRSQDPRLTPKALRSRGRRVRRFRGL